MLFPNGLVVSLDGLFELTKDVDNAGFKRLFECADDLVKFGVLFGSGTSCFVSARRRTCYLSLTPPLDLLNPQ